MSWCQNVPEQGSTKNTFHFFLLCIYSLLSIDKMNYSPLFVEEEVIS